MNVSRILVSFIRNVTSICPKARRASLRCAVQVSIKKQTRTIANIGWGITAGQDHERFLNN